ncbi:MAG TPA: 2-C-methyl-D-erythritol 4-phosphate cytidylyltransferase [Gemmatimonadaceae bacterium]|jgi:2-C-methyl-D-erythritol 4-phosphate cytidylyltransferase|nr:2-C-methyl-D-erythritol 4-phosphate cytidylyltransferase [Gemmatimonadaceae bacterium]
MTAPAATALPVTAPSVPRDVGVVIVAAGTGTRTGSDELKQFRWIAGKPMLLHSVLAFQSRPDVAMVVAVLPKRYAGDPPPWLFQGDLERLLISVGGRERGDSVRNGLEDLPAEVQIVVIHDAARPLVTDATIDAVIAEARLGHGAVAALPIVDTLKRVSADGVITETVTRDNLWRAQTPQAFPRDMIVRAHADAYTNHISATDDAALCERLGLPVHIIPGSERAMKVTTEDDFARAEALSLLPA